MINKLLTANRKTLVLLWAACLTCVMLGMCTQLYAQRSVELTLLSDSRSSVLDHQQWMQAMSEVGANRVKVQTAVRPRPEVTESESGGLVIVQVKACLLYTSPSPRDQRGSRMPSSA